MQFNIIEHPHKRLNILTGEWILVSPHRNKRPWQGKVELNSITERPSYDAGCYLCPGNERADGSKNPDYNDPFAFPNDYAALLTASPDGMLNEEELLVAESQKGICKVICFSPFHHLTLPQMDLSDIVKVVALWQQEFTALAANKWIKYIQIFENKGDIMGCSNPHPHGQIWSLNSIPTELQKETECQLNYYQKHGKSLLSNYLALELAKAERVVCENEHFVALVPFWAVWPFETMIIAKRHVQTIIDFTAAEKIALAEILKKLTIKYDNLFDTSFPYSAGMHQAPVNDGDHAEWHWHMHFYPPLLRNATIKKFMVGFEMLACAQRDITPEYAADQLKKAASVHYKEKAV